ncbi:MAG: DNA-processing protein DprA [Gammaproteobacteria bacterium]
MLKLLEHFGTAVELLAAGRKRWTELGLSVTTRRALEKPDREGLQRDLGWAGEPGHHLIGWGDAAYPPLLATISSPPPVLYVIGDPQLLHQPQLAVVGSRNPSPGGRELAGEFAAFAAGAGLVVTSGLALGIDAAAHAGALDGGGNTVAVMATGPDLIYPKRHQALAERIAERGALVTEFRPGTPPLPEHFPRRNRIISGLALGTLVVEATLKSGSLITARYAAEQGREVFAIPGSVRSPLSRGCHALIRDGAALVEQPSDMLATLEVPLALDFAPDAKVSAPASDAPDPEYALLLDALGFNPVTADTVAARTGLTPQTVSSMLLILELKGEVEVQAGGRYARKRRG